MKDDIIRDSPAIEPVRFSDQLAKTVLNSLLKLAEEAPIKREHERDRLRHSLELAKDILQKLLPKDYPKIAGLDVVGRNIYWDETGGDYYYFIKFREDGDESLTVVVDRATENN